MLACQQSLASCSIPGYDFLSFLLFGVRHCLFLATFLPLLLAHAHLSNDCIGIVSHSLYRDWRCWAVWQPMLLISSAAVTLLLTIVFSCHCFTNSNYANCVLEILQTIPLSSDWKKFDFHVYYKNHFLFVQLPMTEEDFPLDDCALS